MPRSGRVVPLAALLGWLLLGLAAPATLLAASTVSGEAYGVDLTSASATLTRFPEVVLAPEGGAASASVQSVNVPAILQTGAIAVATEGTTSPTGASAESSATVQQLDVLLGLVTADGVTARSSSTCDGTSASSSDAGTTFTNLVVAGTPIGAVPPPNTVIAVPGGTVTLNEQIPGGNGMDTSSLTVNAIRVQVTTLLLGTIDLVVASAHSDVDCDVPVGPTPTPTATSGACDPNPTPSPTPTAGVPIVSGEAFDVFVDVPPVQLAKNPHVVLAPQGGSLAASVVGVDLPGTITTGTLTVNANGATGPTSAASDATAQVEQLNVLAGLVTADLVRSMSSSACDGTTAASNDAGTTFTGLVVDGTPIAGTPPPNTVIVVPGVATVTLNEQTGGGDGIDTSELTVTAVHVVLDGGAGEIVVASAHSDVDCAPLPTPVATSTAPVPTCTPVPTASPTATATATPPATTPTATLTASPTPSPTATALVVLNHFLCYELHSPRADVSGLPLTDQFGAATVDLKKAKRICLPVDKNDEDPLAPGDMEHLIAYTMRQTAPRWQRHKDYTAVNQFGTNTLQIVKPDRLLVPAAKNLAGVPPAPAFVHNHFKCYRTQYTKLRVAGIKTDDQFGTLSVDVKKPLHACVPVDKNGEGIPHPDQALMCYTVRTTPGTTRPPRVLPDRVFIHDQFGPAEYDVRGPRELCVPSVLTPP